MGRYFALALTMPGQTQIKIKPKKAKRSTSPNFGIWVFFLLFVTVASYLLLVNSLSTKGYEIKKLERKLLEFKETNKRLELDVASLKSIQGIEAEIKTLNLVPTTQASYVKDRDFSFNY